MKRSQNLLIANDGAHLSPKVLVNKLESLTKRSTHFQMWKDNKIHTHICMSSKWNLGEVRAEYERMGFSVTKSSRE